MEEALRELVSIVKIHSEAKIITLSGLRRSKNE